MPKYMALAYKKLIRTKLISDLLVCSAVKYACFSSKRCSNGRLACLSFKILQSGQSHIYCKRQNLAQNFTWFFIGALSALIYISIYACLRIFPAVLERKHKALSPKSR